MNRFLQILYIVPFFLSCTNSQEDIPVKEEEQSAIGFNAKVQQTRGITTMTNLQQDGFKVWGGYDKNNVFNSTVVTYSGAEWGYTTPQYWVLDKIYNFYALYPASLGASNDAGSFQITNFDIKENTAKTIENRTDPVCASALDMDSNNPTTVNFTFKHMLAQVELYGQKDAENANSNTVTVTNIKVYGVPNKATYTDIYTTWTATEISTSQNTFFERNSVSQELTTTAADVFGSTLWVAPVLTNQSVISITYTQNGTTKTKEIHPLAYTDGGWQAGKKYRYTFNVIDDGTITFDTPKITPWLTANGSIIIID